MQWLARRAPALIAYRGTAESENLWMSAFLYGLVSAASLPIGAIVGIALSPVEPLAVANIIAFGSGCLLFAVTVELYGEQLMHLEEHNHQEGSSASAASSWRWVSRFTVVHKKLKLCTVAR